MQEPRDKGAVRFLCGLASLREKEKRDKREYQVVSSKIVRSTKNLSAARQAAVGTWPARRGGYIILLAK